MATVHAIHSVGSSLMKYLGNAFTSANLGAEFNCQFLVVSSGEMNGKEVDFAPAVTLYLHRVTVNPYLRNTPHINSVQQATLPLSVDLHYLLTVWADNALLEHTILAWVIRELHAHQTLSQSDLTPEGGWVASDFVQVIPAELSNEDVMRIWDALDPAYRLSVSYVARVVRIDAEAQPDALPVAARRLALNQLENAGP